MLSSLKEFFKRGSFTEQPQLAFEFDAPVAAPKNADDLLDRLRSLGLKKIEVLRLTRNRNVMVSYRGAELRVHRGFLEAPPDIHLAIVAFVQGRTRAERKTAQKRIVSFRIDESAYGPPRQTRVERSRPEDAPIVARLVAAHAAYNAEKFDGSLKTVPVRISRRMKSRLGHYTAASPARGMPGEIAISFRHVRRHGWGEVLHTLLHEMVHQWQDETGAPLDHGPGFRAKAREVGIAAAAKRGVPRPG